MGEVVSRAILAALTPMKRPAASPLKPAAKPAKSPRPIESETHSYDHRTRNNLKRGKDKC